jgi:HD superfamily phosphohydrolase
MSYLYDELNQLRKDTGKTWNKIATELNIPLNTIRKWNKREPHPKYKEKVAAYIRDERQKLTELSKPIFQKFKDNVKIEEIQILEYDENNIQLGFWEKLRDIYLSHKNGESNWEKEQPKLKPIIIQIAEYLKAKDCKVLSPIEHGGTAVILQIRDESLGTLRALKFPRPIENLQELFNEILTTEIGYLLEACHKNIVEVYSRGDIKVDSGTSPFYIMKYIKGAQSAHDYFSPSAKRTAQDLISVVKQVAAAIKHLHSMSIVHLDIKPDNILVSDEGEALLSDLGSARKYQDSDEEVSIIYTRPYAHPNLIRIKAYSTSDSNRYRGSIKRREIDHRFDIYAFGKSLLELINRFDPNIVTERMRPYERKYLLLMACRALDGQNSHSETALGLPRTAFQELKYNSFDEILDDIDKLTGEFALHKKLPELNPYIIETVQIASNWKTPLTPRLTNLLAHPSLQRLAGVSQLGLVIQLYPTATHTRLQHSLGVFSNTIRIIESLYNDPVNPLFKQVMNISDLKRILLAALFHDLGHFPLAHDLHEALPNVFEHDSIAKSILRGDKDWFKGNTLRKLVKDDWNIDTKMIAEIIEADPKDSNQPIKSRILNTIINGPIDADKLDYLIRDARTLNVPYASVIDLERLLSCLTIVYNEEGTHTYAALGIHEKGKFSAESVAFARYAMFGTVYWHHMFRAVKSMLHRAVWECRLHSYGGPNGDRELRNAFFNRFIEFVTSPSMFQEKELDTLTQVFPSDREVLNWFLNHTTDKGKMLIRMINSRQLFKRICVLSPSKYEICQQLIDFRKGTTNCKDIIKLQDRIQESILECINNLTQSDRDRNSTLTFENTEKVIQMHSESKILFLIDIPVQKIDDSDLRYLPESERHSMLKDWSDPVPLESSTFWTQLHDNFIRYVGKIRLFGHPEIDSIVTAAISHDQFVHIIEGALRYVQK